VEQASKAKIAYLDFASTSDHDVGGLEIAMHDPVPVQVNESLQQLVQNRFDSSCGYCLALRLVVVVDDLEQVVFGILKHNVDALVLQDDFYRVHDIWMCELGAQGHFSNGRLRNARILQLAFFIRLEPSRVGLACRLTMLQSAYFLMANSPVRPFLPSAL